MKNFYTLQEYVMEINGKRVFDFQVKAYPRYENALFTFGRGNHEDIRPYAEEFLTSKKEGEERKKGLEETINKSEEYELFNHKDHGLLDDYYWFYNEKHRVNVGILKSDMDKH